VAEKYFVDTNILIYAHDVSQGSKHQSARELVDKLWDSGEGVLSTQVLQELCVNLQQKVANRVPIQEVRRVLEDYLHWEIVVNTPDSALQALDLQARYRISFWDALILHAAETAGATVLYSEDLSSGQSYGAVRVVNPFTSGG
jgi:predicted nucleic acid-binding protein